MPALPSWADTTGESPIYPVGDGVAVYRAVLDFIYIDGDIRPTLIVMHDSAEGRSGAGPCAFAKCLSSWSHKSRIDTATVLSFARLTRKSPAIRVFGYPIPIVFLSLDDVHRMNADGNELMAANHQQGAGGISGFWTEFQRKYPTAWGVSFLTKVGFNPAHTEALVQVRQWCGNECRSNEVLFLKRTGRAWTVVERIPDQADQGYSTGKLRYIGPIGATPKESELIPPPAKSGSPTEASARIGVYRAVLDSLYSFAGESPQTIVLTDGFRVGFDSLPKHSSVIDRQVLRKFKILQTVRAPLDTKVSSRIPIVRFSRDSAPGLEKIGSVLDAKSQTGDPKWLAFTRRYPTAWGMIGLSRIAFDNNRTQALVYTNHTCGVNCDNGDVWFLRRAGQRWQIVERIPRGQQPDWQIEPLRYLGLDANPKSYRPRRVQGFVTNAETRRRVPLLPITVRYNNPAGFNSADSVIRTDSAGHYTLSNLPLWAGVLLRADCRDHGHPPPLFTTMGVTPGMDTTINLTIDYRACIDVPPVVPINTLSGAQAFIGPDEARFIFPRQANNSYSWDAPTKAYKDRAHYMWDVTWEIPDNRDGSDPFMLWLIQRWNPGGPRKGSLKALIAGVKLEPMINCTTCDGAVFADPETNYSNVFATVESGQLVFIIRGADAVRRIFPTLPSRVTFTAAITESPKRGYGPGYTNESQTVIVNCRNSEETREARHRCDAQKVPPALNPAR